MNKPANLERRLKIIQIGKSAAVVLPKDVLDSLNLAVGDSLSCHQTTGGITLSNRDPEFDHQLAQARALMKTDRNALRELAK